MSKYQSTVMAFFVDIIAGNIATAEGARDLIAAGADGLKVYFNDLSLLVFVKSPSVLLGRSRTGVNLHH